MPELEILQCSYAFVATTRTYNVRNAKRLHPQSGNKDGEWKDAVDELLVLGKLFRLAAAIAQRTRTHLRSNDMP